MKNHSLTLSIGGQDRELHFGKMGIYQHLKDASGKDPLIWITEFSKTAAQDLNTEGVIVTHLENIACIIYAGLNLALDIKDEPNVSIDKVKKWTRALGVEDMTPIVTKFIESLSVDEDINSENDSDKPGEVTTQAAKS